MDSGLRGQYEATVSCMRPVQTQARHPFPRNGFKGLPHLYPGKSRTIWNSLPHFHRLPALAKLRTNFWEFHPIIQAVTGHSQSFRDLCDWMPLFHGLPNGFLFELVVISGLSLWMLLSWLNPAIQWRLQNSGKSSFVVELARLSPHLPEVGCL